MSKEKTNSDLGFGVKAIKDTSRFINKDGTFNVARKETSWKINSFEFYHKLIAMTWTQFLFTVIGLYTVLNFIFACLYFLIGTHHLAGSVHGSAKEEFMDAFFFSSQTITTLGYGRIAPIGFLANCIAALESMLGLLGFALATGLLYGRFSRPVAKILYSNNALIAPYRDGKGFMFRLVNGRHNQLIETEVDVTLTMNKDKNGNSFRSYDPLKLEIKKINFLALSWTVVHPIDEQSPMCNLTLEDLKKNDAEFIILFKAFDDTFSQNVYSRYSYKAYEIINDAKFISMIGTSEGSFSLDMSKINSYEKVV